MKAIDALYEAHKIAFSPFLFETVYCMLELKVFDEIADDSEGSSIDSIMDNTGLPRYGLGVLLEMAEVAEIVTIDADHQVRLTKIGFFLRNDKMVQVNIRFTHNVCFRGLHSLKESIESGNPEGLKSLGDWKTVYEGLSELPEDIKKSWFEFDHFYSDNSFEGALAIIFKDSPKQIFDIGGNTGKWAKASTQYNSEVKVKIFDLPGQIAVAKENIVACHGISDRVEYQEIDLLKQTSEIPAGADVYWMSQFLDCFSEHEIESILRKIRKNIQPNARIYIMETFTDNQRFPAAKYSLVATSLYFTAIANGNSKMYSSSVFKYIVDKAGFDCIQEHQLHQNSFHSILELAPRA